MHRIPEGLAEYRRHMIEQTADEHCRGEIVFRRVGQIDLLAKAEQLKAGRLARPPWCSCYFDPNTAKSMITQTYAPVIRSV